MKKNEFLSVCMSLGVILFLVGILAFVSMIPDGYEDQSNKQFAVVFSPDTTREQAMSQVIESGGYPIRAGAFDFIVIAAAPQSDFQSSVKGHGALFSFSPLIKGGCIITNKTAFKKEI